MTRYLLDTNQISDAVGRVSIVRDRIQRGRANGLIVGTSLPVICELEAGLQGLEQPDRPRRVLEFMLGRTIKLWPMTRSAAILYGQIYQDLRGRGRVLSQVDLMLAALCFDMGLTLLTSDQDFRAIPDLNIEDWTRPS